MDSIFGGLPDRQLFLRVNAWIYKKIVQTKNNLYITIEITALS